MDPVAVLNANDEDWFIRLAAIKVIANDRDRSSSEENEYLGQD